MNFQNGNKTFISLKEAAKICPYSYDYLRLRARQGRLKAIKIAGKWLTKKEWLDEYIQRAELWKQKRNKTQITKKQKQEIQAQPQSQTQVPTPFLKPSPSLPTPQPSLSLKPLLLSVFLLLFL
ncbi:helix-turn-helix domain-containing protein, partial [bacterium]|nr:helix-turn-helix domain-containing protein [bacterium]